MKTLLAIALIPFCSCASRGKEPALPEHGKSDVEVMRNNPLFDFLFQ